MGNAYYLALIFALLFSATATLEYERLSNSESSISHSKRTVEKTLYNSSKPGNFDRIADHSRILEVHISSENERVFGLNIKINQKTSDICNTCENMSNPHIFMIEQNNDINIACRTGDMCDEAKTKTINPDVAKYGIKDHNYSVGNLDSEEKCDNDDKKEVTSHELQEERSHHLYEENKNDCDFHQGEGDDEETSPVEQEPLDEQPMGKKPWDEQSREENPWEEKPVEEIPKKDDHYMNPTCPENLVVTKTVEVTVSVTKHEIKTVTERETLSQTYIYTTTQELRDGLKTPSGYYFPMPSAKPVLIDNPESPNLATGVNKFSASRVLGGSMPSETTFPLMKSQSPAFTSASVRLEVIKSLFFSILVISLMAIFFLN